MKSTKGRRRTFGRQKRKTALRHFGFLFSGKELDAETGNYYYGARYLAPRIGIWLSPDPMQLKYPHVSSYAFCKGNPMSRIDLFGMDDYQLQSNGYICLSQKNNDKFDNLIHGNKSIRINDKKQLPQLTQDL